MHIFLILLVVALFSALVLLAALQPVRSSVGYKELKRRSKQSDAAMLELDRYELYPSLVTLLMSVRTVLLLALMCAAIGGFGWWLGALIALVLGVLYPAFARLKLVMKWAKALNKKIEPFLLDAASRFEDVLGALRDPGTSLGVTPMRAHSREELTEIIDHSKGILESKERQLLMAALAFPSKTVEALMVPRENIHSIEQSEFLGPLVLDELHAKGYDRLPVIAKDLDHIVGILHLRDLLSLDIRRSTTAEKAMEKRVHTVSQDATLERALEIFLTTHDTMLIVINSTRETVGLLTLEDVIEALTGRERSAT